MSDVSADADPYTGLAVHYTAPEGCYTEYEELEEGKPVVKTLNGWCQIGGTSLSSPLVASVFALAGGANEVSYPARTLYENRVKLPGALHDITAGSNGECNKPFTQTGLSGCTSAEEAAASCPTKQASCLAGKRYDGPTGVGTPKGIGAFSPIPGPFVEEPAEEPPAEEEAKEGTTGKEKSTTESPLIAGSTIPPAPPPQGSPSPSGAGAAAKIAITRLGLTSAALVALNRSHPRLSKVGFAFTISAGARVRVTFTKRLHRHGRSSWAAMARSFTVGAARGNNVRRLSGRRSLSAGLYRLTLTPGNGSPRSLQFRIG